MATITLKEIPTSVHTALKLRAKQHGRSLNKEALACLADAVQAERTDPDAFLLDIRRHRSSLPGRLKDTLLRDARATGRP
jgi:plasmid stability protein